jgi:hypothetical protein
LDSKDFTPAGVISDKAGERHSEVEVVKGRRAFTALKELELFAMRRANMMVGLRVWGMGIEKYNGVE